MKELVSKDDCLLVFGDLARRPRVFMYSCTCVTLFV